MAAGTWLYIPLPAMAGASTAKLPIRKPWKQGVRNGVSLPPHPGLVQRVSAVPMAHAMG
jgi:hypothetical protein